MTCEVKDDTQVERVLSVEALASFLENAGSEAPEGGECGGKVSTRE